MLLIQIYLLAEKEDLMRAWRFDSIKGLYSTRENCQKYYCMNKVSYLTTKNLGHVNSWFANLYKIKSHDLQKILIKFYLWFNHLKTSCEWHFAQVSKQVLLSPINWEYIIDINIEFDGLSNAYKINWFTKR